MSFRCIVVPLDGSELSARALPIAEMLASASDAQVHLLMVDAGLQPANTRAKYAYLQEIADRERAEGIAVRPMVRGGEPADAILILAQEVHADLIVMATSGRSGIGRIVMGSVADKVARSSSVPVVLLRPDQLNVERLETILVPVDATPEGSAALEIAAPLAHASHARVVLVHAHATRDPRAMEPVLASLKRAGVEAEVHIEKGKPSEVINATAKAVQADLIVMSTHARGGPVRSILGSVADEVVRSSNRPVLLLRRTAGGGSLLDAG